jgi:tetratricopeptide (TPR) repeat protein
LWSRAAAVHAETIAARRGPAAAIEWIQAARGVDLTRPHDADLLRVLVDSLIAAGRIGDAREAVETALAAHTDAAAFHEIHGRVLDGEEASPEKIRAANERAVELDPKQARALEALGRIAQEQGDTEAALTYYDRATAKQTESLSAARRAARLVADASRLDEAETRWEELLRERPWDTGAAMALAKLRIEREADLDRTLELAQRAVLFRGGPSAHSLLAQVYELRGEVELAAAARSNSQSDPQLSADAQPKVEEDSVLVD